MRLDCFNGAGGICASVASRRAARGRSRRRPRPSAVEHEHRLQRGDRHASGPRRDLGQPRRQRADRADQRADEAVAREDRGALAVVDDVREHRLLERQEHADVAARWIERADDGDEQQRPEIGDDARSPSRSPPSARSPRAAACDSEAMGVQTDGERQHAGAEQRAGRDDADLEGTEPELEQIDRQQQADEAVAERAQAATQSTRRTTGGIIAAWAVAEVVERRDAVGLGPHADRARAGNVGVVELDVRLAVERDADARARNSTRSVCHSFPATGASTYLIVIRRPFCV